MVLCVQAPRCELSVTPTAVHSSVMHSSSSSEQHPHLTLHFSCAQSPTGFCTRNLIVQPSLSCTAMPLPTPLFADTLSKCKPCAMTTLARHCPERWLQPA